MNWDDVFKLAAAILTSVGGASLLIVGLSSWLGKVWANRILEKDRLKYNSELEKIKSQLQIENQKQQLMFSMYFEGQFKLYNDLWLALSELQDEVDKLWEEASKSNLRSFIKAIQQAKRQIKNSAILIEQEHYEQIMNNLKAFEDYRIGKERLINIYDSNNICVNNDQIEELIRRNREKKHQIEYFIKAMLSKMRSQISGRVQLTGNNQVNIQNQSRSVDIATAIAPRFDYWMKNYNHPSGLTHNQELLNWLTHDRGARYVSRDYDIFKSLAEVLSDMGYDTMPPPSIGEFMLKIVEADERGEYRRSRNR